MTVREWFRLQRKQEASGEVPSDASVFAHRLLSGEIGYQYFYGNIHLIFSEKYLEHLVEIGRTRERIHRAAAQMLGLQ